MRLCVGESEESLGFLSDLRCLWPGVDRQERGVVYRRAELVFGDIEQEMPVTGLAVRLITDEEDVVRLGTFCEGLEPGG